MSKKHRGAKQRTKTYRCGKCGQPNDPGTLCPRCDVDGCGQPFGSLRCNKPKNHKPPCGHV